MTLARVVSDGPLGQSTYLSVEHPRRAAPNVVPLLATLGLMGFAGFPLRTGASIILPVTLRVAIDTTTHYLKRAREASERTGDYAEAVRGALLGTRWSMVSSTFALVLGFCASEVPVLQRRRHPCELDDDRRACGESLPYPDASPVVAPIKRGRADGRPARDPLEAVS